MVIFLLNHQSNEKNVLSIVCNERQQRCGILPQPVPHISNSIHLYVQPLEQSILFMLPINYARSSVSTFELILPKATVHGTKKGASNRPSNIANCVVTSRETEVFITYNSKQFKSLRHDLFHIIRQTSFTAIRKALFTPRIIHNT